MKAIGYVISALISVGIVVFAVKQIMSFIRDVRDRVSKKSSKEGETKTDESSAEEVEKGVHKDI